MPTAVRERRTKSRRTRRGYSRRLLGDQVCEPRRVAGRASCSRRRSRSSSCTSPTSPASPSGSGRRRSTPISPTSPCSRWSSPRSLEGVRHGFAPLAPGRSLWLPLRALPRVDVRRGRARPPPRSRVRAGAPTASRRRSSRSTRCSHRRCRCSCAGRATCCSALVARALELVRDRRRNRAVLRCEHLPRRDGRTPAGVVPRLGRLRGALGSGAPRRDRRRRRAARALGRALVATASPRACSG